MLGSRQVYNIVVFLFFLTSSIGSLHPSNPVPIESAYSSQRIRSTLGHIGIYGYLDIIHILEYDLLLYPIICNYSPYLLTYWPYYP